MNLHSSMVDTRWPIRGAGSKTSTSSMAFAFGFCIWFLLLCYDFLHSAAVTNGNKDAHGFSLRFSS